MAINEIDIHLHIVLVLGIVKKGNKFLLAKRSSKDPQAGGEWAVPGGKVDLETGFEIIKQTLKRELLEEVGIEIQDEIKFICDDAFVRVSGHHVVSMTFLCEYKSGTAKPLEDQEDVGWFTIREIYSLPNFGKYNLKRFDKLKTL